LDHRFILLGMGEKNMTICFKTLSVIYIILTRHQPGYLAGGGFQTQDGDGQNLPVGAGDLPAPGSQGGPQGHQQAGQPGVLDGAAPGARQQQPAKILALDFLNWTIDSSSLAWVKRI
jgi:hypothetical protein